MNFVKHNKKQIEKIQRRALSVVHEKYDSNLYQLLALSKTASFHIKFIHKILEEIYKTLKKQTKKSLGKVGSGRGKLNYHCCVFKSEVKR